MQVKFFTKALVMSYIVYHTNSPLKRSIIGNFIPDASLIVSYSNSISLYTLELTLLKNKILFDRILQIEKYRLRDHDGVAMLFEENKLSFVYYDYTTNDFKSYCLKCFSAYPSEGTFFRIQNEVGFMRLNDLHFAMFHVHQRRQSVVFSFKEIKKDLRNVSDACFLAQYKLPTVCLLYRPHINKYTRDEDVRVLVVSFDLDTKSTYVLYDYQCMPHSHKVVGLDSVFVVVSRDTLSFYKNEYLVQIASSGHPPATENQGSNEIQSEHLVESVQRINLDATMHTAKDETNVERTMGLPQSPRNYVEMEWDSSTFVSLSSSLMIFGKQKTVLITAKEDSHRIYGLTISEVDFKARNTEGATNAGCTILCVGADMISMFRNIIFDGKQLFILERAGHEVPTKGRNIEMTVEDIRRLDAPLLEYQITKTEVGCAGYNKIHVARDVVCLSNSEKSVLCGSTIDCDTLNLSCFGSMYYHISSSRLEVLDSHFASVRTLEFMNRIRRAETCGNMILTLENSTLTIRNLEMKVVKEVGMVSNFCAHEFLVVMRGDSVEVIDILSAGTWLGFCFADFGQTIRSYEGDGRVPVSGAETYGKVVEVESVGSWMDFCLILRTDGGDMLIYRRLKDVLVKVQHSRIPKLSTDKAFFVFGAFVYVKAEDPLIITKDPFVIQDFPHKFEHVSNNFGILGDEVLAIGFSWRGTQEDDMEGSVSARVQAGYAVDTEVVGLGTGAVRTKNTNNDDNASANKQSVSDAPEEPRMTRDVLEIFKDNSKNFVFTTTTPSTFFKEKVETQPGNSEEEEAVEQLGALTLQFYIELRSGDLHVINEYKLLKDEYINSVKMLEVNDIHSKDGKNEFIVACTSYVKSEDWQFKGRLLIFEVIEVNPLPLMPWTNRRLKILCIENCKGPVLDSCSLRGNIACCIGTKLMVFEVDKNEGTNAIAFHDLQILATKIRSVKNYVCTGDIANGLLFFYFQAKPFKIHQLASSTKFSCEELDFIVHNDALSIVSYGDETYRIFTYSPNDAVFNGAELVERCEFRCTHRVRVDFLGSDVVERLYFGTLKYLKNTCGLVPTNVIAAGRLQLASVKPPVYGLVLHEFLGLSVQEQQAVCKCAGVDRAQAMASLRGVLNK